MRPLHVPIQVVCYQDDGEWVAHCLEFDLMGSGDTPTAAVAELADAVHTQVACSVELGNPANLFRPADGGVFAAFAAGHAGPAGDRLHVRVRPVTIANAAVRQYDGAALLAAS